MVKVLSLGIPGPLALQAQAAELFIPESFSGSGGSDSKQAITSAGSMFMPSSCGCT